MSYWLVGVPGRISLDEVAAVTQRPGYSTNYVFPIPQLKVGTLDSLMSLSEELARIDPIIQSIVFKLEKAYTELVTTENIDNAKTGNGTASASTKQSYQPVPQSAAVDLRIDDSTLPSDYIKKFKWNDIRFNKRVALNQLVDTAYNECVHADEDLKRKQGEYSELKAAIQAVERVEYGSLQTRNIAQYVQPKHYIDTENLTTLFVVVPRSRQAEFESEYSVWNADITKQSRSTASNSHSDKGSSEQKQAHDDLSSENKPLPSHIPPVVPGSLLLIHDDPTDDSVLYRVIVLKRGVEQYKQAVRDHRLTVRQYSPADADTTSSKAQYEELKQKRKQVWNHLVRFTKTMYSECFINYVHLKAIRLYVEAVLRYGLPVDFKAVLMEPQRGKEKQLRDALRKLFQSSSSSQRSQSDSCAEVDAGLGGIDTEEFYNYVYIPLKIAD